MDETEEIRRALIPEMEASLKAATERGEQVWSSDELRAEFEAIGFMAPFVVVRRRSDGVIGSMQFTHHPRYYFGFVPD